MCGSYGFSKNTLLGLNIVYVMVAFLLIGVATYGQTSSRLTSLPILGGIVASGVFLLLISVIGLIATLRHHQVMLFVYMLVMVFIFVIQFSVSCAALAVNKEQELNLAKAAWDNADVGTKFDTENYFSCCGFQNSTSEGVRCSEIAACKPPNSCHPCKDAVEDKIGYAFSASGGLGLFFAFSQLVAVIVSFGFRRQLRDVQTV